MEAEANQPESKRQTWLVAAWPGMGNVGVGAAAYLINKLGARLIHEMPGRDLFDLQNIEVKEGLATAGRMPRSMFFHWSHPTNNHDLLIFIGEAQPQVRGYAFCHRVLEFAQARGISRVFTFAAMATQLHPSNTPRVFSVATDRDLLQQLRGLDTNVLREGQISGLNGVLIAAAIERGLPGVCLLGELPFFAAGVPNPKASQAVLEVFSNMAGIEMDFTQLREQAEAVEKGLLELLEKMKQAAREQQEAGEEGGFTVPEFATEPEESEEATESEEKPRQQSLDYATRKRIEGMFEAASRDRSRAVALKEELDRLGVFRQYEDRFLDLFKKAE